MLTGLHISPTSQREYTYMNVTMTCYFSELQCAGESPQWRGPALATREYTTEIITSGQLLLSIEYIQEEDEGEYYCFCGWNISASSDLDVLSKPSFVLHELFHKHYV